MKKYKFRLILLAISFLLYGNTMRNGYALDDEFVTGPNNITAKGFKALLKVFKVWHVTDETGNNYEYRPMVKVTYAIEHGLWGENLMLSHLVNILLYALALMVLFNFLKFIFNDYDEFFVFCIVVIFAFIPLHAEVVASLKNRDVILSFIFSFYGSIKILHFFSGKRRSDLLLAFLMLGLAFLSKFDVFPFMVIVPLIVYQKYKINVKVFATLIVIFILSALVYKITKGSMLDRAAVIPHRTFLYFENPLYFGYHFPDRFSAGLNSLGFYTLMLLFPAKMASYYGYNTIPIFSFISFYALIGLLTASWLAYIFFRRFKKPDLLWYGVVFFSFSISMYLNVVVPAAGIVADRFAFFASVGFSIIAVYFLLVYNNNASKKISAIKDLKPYQKYIPLTVFIIFSLMIINRNKEWNNKALLFESDLKKRPGSVKLALLQSSQLIININDRSKSADLSDNEKIQKIRSAEEVLRKAIQIDSSCGGCYNNLSFMYLTFERRPDLALPYLLLGYKRDTTKKELVCNIGIAYYRMGEIDMAEKYLLKAIELDNKKDFMVPYEVLCDLYLKKDPQKGIVLLKGKLEENPGSELYNVLLGKMYFDIRDTANSLAYYKEALKINPNNRQVGDFVTTIEVKYLKKNW